MNGQEKPFGGISGSTLKLFAILTMLIDHTGATVIRAILRHPAILADPARTDAWTALYQWSRDLGRLAFPVFCFFIAEGFTHTRNVTKYAGRLFLFALISEFPFDLALKGNWYFPAKQNVYFTLLIGLLVLIGLSWIETFVQRFSSSIRPFLLLPAYALIICAGMYLAYLLDTDYNFKGVFLIAALYLTRNVRLFQCLTGAAAVAWELPASVGFLPVYLYNGKRGRPMKYFFYWFYPVHLMILHVLSVHVIPAL